MDFGCKVMIELVSEVGEQWEVITDDGEFLGTLHRAWGGDSIFEGTHYRLFKPDGVRVDFPTFNHVKACFGVEAPVTGQPVEVM